jgi:hypothetical protein
LRYRGEGVDDGSVLGFQFVVRGELRLEFRALDAGERPTSAGITTPAYGS